MRDMYQWSLNPDGSICCVATTAAATAQLTDTLTVNDTGGPGVYSLSYIFSLDGTLDSSDESLFQPSFCTSIFLPQGVGTETSYCLSPGQTVPSSFTLTYADLPFGQPIDPTLLISAYGLIYPIDPDQVGGPDDTIINGNMNVDFGSTVTLTDLLVTDANGNPIPDVTLSSADGYTYPVDPSNSLATPEPAWLAPIGLLGLALFGRLRRGQIIQR
jgi:hypothetical protein